MLKIDRGRNCSLLQRTYRDRAKDTGGESAGAGGKKPSRESFHHGGSASCEGPKKGRVLFVCLC